MSFTFIQTTDSRMRLQSVNLMIRWKDPDLPLYQGVTIGEVIEACMSELWNSVNSPEWENELRPAWQHLKNARDLLEAADDV